MNENTNVQAKAAKSILKRRQLTRMLCEGALLVAVSQILGYLKFFEFPNGGSVTLAMFPVIFFAVRWGLKNGLMACFVFGVLQFMFDGGFALGWQSILGDYLLAFTVLGLAGVFRGKKWGIFAGTVLGCAARFAVHYVVGATIWAEWMPEAFFNMTMTNPWFYSLLYNGSYMLADMVLALVIAGLLYVPMKKYMLGADIQK